jgi:hypothetical protein
MKIGPFIRELLAEPVIEPVPEMLPPVGPIEAPLPENVDAEEAPVPAER